MCQKTPLRCAHVCEPQKAVIHPNGQNQHHLGSGGGPRSRWAGLGWAGVRAEHMQPTPAASRVPISQGERPPAGPHPLPEPLCWTKGHRLGWAVSPPLKTPFLQPRGKVPSLTRGSGPGVSELRQHSVFYIHPCCFLWERPRFWHVPVLG